MKSLLVYACGNSNRFDKIKIIGLQIKFLYFLNKFLCATTILVIVLLLKLPTFQTLNLKSNLLDNLNIALSQQNVLFCAFIYGGIIYFLMFLWTLKKQTSFRWLKLKFLIFLILDSNAKLISIVFCYIIKLQSDSSLNSIFFIIGSTISIVLILLISIFFKYFLVTNKYFCQNELQKRKCTSLANLQIMEFIGIIIICFSQKSIEESQLSICLVFLYIFLTSLIKFIVNIKQRRFINEQTNLINSFVITLEAITSLVTFLGVALPTQIIKQNIMYLLMVSYVFGIFAIKNYLISKREEFKMKEPQQLLDQNQTIFYLQTLFDLIVTKNQNRQNEMIFIALKKSHQFQCENSNCYCSSQNQLKNKFFQRKFIEQVLDKISLKFSKNKEICLKAQYFRYQYYKNSYKSYNKLQQFKQDSDQIYLKSFIQNLQQNIKNDIKYQSNQEAKNSLQLQLPFEVELINQKLLNLIKNDIEIRMLKWNYIYQGFCNSIELQNYVIRARDNIFQVKKIYNKHFQNFKQNENFIFLMYFYFNSVSFSRKQTELLFKLITQKLKNAKRNFSSDEKEIIKLLITDKCDVLLVDIKNPEGLIINCTKTVQKNLSYKKKQLVDKKLKIIIPSTYYENHNVLIQKWKYDSNITNLPSMKKAQIIDKKINVLSTYLKLKVFVHENKFCVISALFYQSSQQILLVNSKKEIQFFSQELSNIFLQNKLKLFKIPLQLLFLNSNQYNTCINTNQERTLQGTFINLGKYKQEVFLILRKLENTYDKQAQQTQKIRKSIINKFRNFVNQHIKKSLISVKIKYVRKLMNDKEYFIIKIISLESRQINSVRQIKQEQQNIQKMNRKQRIQKVQNSENIIFQQPDSQQHLQSNQNQNVSLLFKNQATEVDNIQKSIASSTHNNQNIAFHALMDTLAIKSQNPIKIYDKRLFIYSLQVILISILGIAILYISYYLNGLGFAQIQDVYFADGAVSDNMQLYQFTYNRLMSLKQHINNQTNFRSILQSAKIQKEYVYSLFSLDIFSYISQKTPMQGLKYYQYLNHSIVWCGQTGIKNNLTILQFFQGLNYITSRIYNYGYPTNETDLIEMLNLFQTNFAQLKRVNHNQLVIYQVYSISTLNLLNWLTFSIVFFHVIFVFYLIVMIERHNSFRFNQKINCLNIYAHIPNIELLQTKNYYQFLFETTKKKIDDKLKELIKLSTQKLNLNYHEISQNNIKKKSNQSNQVQIRKVHKSYTWIFYLFVFLFVNGSYFFGTYFVISLYQPCQFMMDAVNALMDSQNYLIQAFVDFKAQFIIKNNTIMSEKYFQQFLIDLNKSVVVFAQITSQQSILFQSYDPTFHDAYKQLLINDACELDYGQITDYQYQKCVSDLFTAIINKGVVAGMVYTQRMIQKNVYASINKTFTYNEAVQLFNGPDFRQVDQSLIYMFKLYQATQAQIYLSLYNDIQGALTINFYFSLVQMFLSVFLIIWVLGSYKQQKVKLGKLYGTFMLIPIEVAQKIGSWRRLIVQYLEYDEKS